MHKYELMYINSGDHIHDGKPHYICEPQQLWKPSSSGEVILIDQD